MAKTHDVNLDAPRRTFLKHKITGAVWAVEINIGGDVLAALAVYDSLACRHTLQTYWLLGEDVDDLNANSRDFLELDPPCSDPIHLLTEIGEQDRRVQQAKLEWEMAHNGAKVLRETFAQEQTKLLSLVRRATREPSKLPLFDAPAEEAPPPASDDAPPPTDQQPSA